ncbi:MAG: AIPR family protein, partial [Candidatus Azotimanducaceae bacterium WSBS_2022_MAG_OTU7]
KPSVGITTKGAYLKQSVTARFSNAGVDVEFVGAKQLLELARRSPQTTYILTLAENPISSDDQVGFVGLIGLVDFYRFLKDSKGDMNRQIFEANVRDYQGRTVVNDEIQNTLRGGNREDFWWLNNGVSIIAAKASQSGKTITVEDPQIVNGLQTSTEIFNYCNNCNVDSENRKLLIRIVVPSAAESRDMVIKATNSQTSVKPASLRATDKIHRNIEEYLRSRGLYYDRRKNFYKNQGKPKNKIIGIPYLAQAVMSVVLGQPDTARARPSSLLKNDDDYVKIFNEDFPIELYYVCAEAMYQVTEHFKAAKDSLSTPERNDLRFYVVMHSVRSALGKKTPSKSDVASFDLKNLTGAVIQSSLDVVKGLYEAAGANDKIAKGKDFAKRVKDDLT